MKSIADLLDTLPIPDPQDITITTDGYTIWMTWYGDLNPIVTQTLQDYGGLTVTSDGNQALWFFFTSDILLALAKLAVWAKFNPLSMTLEAFPATLLVGIKKNLALKVDKSLANQMMQPPDQGLFTWIHPKLQEVGHNIPGLTFEEKETLEGLADFMWFKFTADTRLPYTSSQGWYAIVHPLGNPLDKNFQSGWRAMFTQVEMILQRLKLKYSIHDNFLMIPLDNLRQLRNWIREAVQTFFGTKEAAPDDYWPCVSVVVDRRGLNFNNELPHKVNVKWDGLTPDFPYMSYRNAYLLGEGYLIQDLHFAGGTSSIDTWCTVNLEEYSIKTGIIPVLMPSKLVTGSGEGCFYCGVKTHDSAQCPSRKLNTPSLTFWKDFNNLDIEEINTAFRNIEMKLSQNGHAGYNQLFEAKSTEARVLEAVFSINSTIQLRSVERIWLLSGKDITMPVDDHPYVEDSMCWSLLERMRRIGPNELAIFEKDVLTAINRTPRDWRLKSLLGFIALERGDPHRALLVWKEAESHSSSVLHQGWHYFLQARIYELQMRFSDAMDLYDTVQRLLPSWIEPDYRKLVCRVKMGFAEQIQSKLIEMVQRDSTLFNRVLVDPELERGQMPLLAALYPQWIDSLKQAAAERSELLNLLKEVNSWFPPEHAIASNIRRKLESLIGESEIRNYLAFLNIMRVRPQIENELNLLIEKEIDTLQDKFRGFLSTLEVIRDEASWFPFPRTLVDFNRDFNECAGILNWAFAANFHKADAFKRAQAYTNPLTDLLTRLENKLKFIRTIRDSTLFILLLTRSFLWIELVAMIVAFITVPVFAFYGNDLGLGWLQRLIRINFWELQKVLVGVISLTALGIAALRTTLVFEKKRDEMVESARLSRQNMQRKRLKRIQDSKQHIKENAKSLPKPGEGTKT